jgi:glutamate synthase (NADPH/NADH) small chain
MLQFVTVQAQYPVKRPAYARVLDLAEIQDGFDVSEAAAQSARCAQCGVPFCQVHCPLSNNIPDWLKLAAEGRLREAYELAESTNNMPEICGRICPQDRLCEGNCVIEQSAHGAVTIGSIEKYLADTAFKEGWVKPIRPRKSRRETIGIVGAGPAGLAAAEQLCKQGYGVTVYDRHDRAGGLLIYGIPNFKLEKTIVNRRVARLRDGGIRFELGVQIGSSLPFNEIRNRHDAILIATGTYRPRRIEAEGTSLNGVVRALDYLIASNRKGLGDTVPEHDSGALDAAGKDVIVIGGGDTAMDCVRTAVRQSARSVTCLYRRDRKNMPGSAREVLNAEEEGVRFEWLAAPEMLDGLEAVARVCGARMKLSAADAGGRRGIEKIDGANFDLEAQMVIVAAGFDPEPLPRLFAELGLLVSPTGTLRIDRKNFMTSLEGVFAAGDIVRGASLVVWAIRDGRDAAAAMHKYLMAKQDLIHAAE